ncbi:AraC family transcriptional regulator [Pinisolibacter sp.]|uniref:AraC family transcriptional regulator n=1 Tax=Pinisolibacter sp. TaxID=2172024 RepID=UPI002FDD9885
MEDRHKSAGARIDPASRDVRTGFVAAVGRPLFCEDLFDAVPDIVFFVKDAAGRYVAVNRTLVTRTGRRTKDELLGRTAEAVFPGALGLEIARQDAAVLANGRPIHGRLELHIYPGGEEGWCLTWKEPIFDGAGSVVGLSGISRDLRAPSDERDDLAGLQAVIEHVHAHLDEPLRIADLARLARLTAFRLDQRLRALFGLSAGQYLTRVRVEAALSLLRTTDRPIAAVALDCGYSDQAAFSRQFRKSVGLTPSQYRSRHRGERS